MRLMILTFSIFAAFSSVLGAEVAYFIVGEKAHFEGDSCLLVLTNDAEIMEARRQLRDLSFEERPFPAVIVAKGGDGMNRDYLNNGSPAWSWTIVDLVGFYQIGIPENEGSPTQLEAHEWQTNRSLSMIRYAIHSEIPAPLVAKVKNIVGGVELSWPALGTDYRYTVEMSTNLSSDSWAPLENRIWPITGNQCSLSHDPSFGGIVFYRVQAEQVEDQ